MAADNQKKVLFLLDAFALIYRAHFAFISRPLINSKGLDTGAISGFTRSLWEVIDKQKPSHIGVAFDLPGKTFRHKMYEPYKANRDEQPEAITGAIPYIKQIIEAFNLPILSAEGYEADDVVGTIAKKAEKEGYTVYMMTPDKDYAQLVSPNIYMYKPASRGNGIDVLGEDEVREKFGINEPEQVIDMLGMMGDSSDNIPGIPGIGPKTAQKLLAQFDSLEGVIANVDQLKGKQQERVRDNVEQARMSRVLATISTDAPIDFVEKDLRVEEPNREKLEELFRELEFRGIARTVLGASANEQPQGVQASLFGSAAVAPAQSPPQKPSVGSFSIAEKNMTNVEHDYKAVTTPEEINALVKQLSAAKYVCFDTETTSVDATTCELVGIAFSMKKGTGYYVPVPTDKQAAMELIAPFKALLEHDPIIKIGQNIKYDMIVLRRYGINVQGAIYDTMLAHYLLEPELRHNMNYMSETLLGYQPLSIETLIGKKGKHQLSMRDIDVKRVTDYAAEDADVTLQLFEVLNPKLQEEDELKQLMSDLELPLVPVLADMEYEGVNIDTDFLSNYSKELDEKIKAAEKAIYEAAGVQFNIASPKQIGEVLFDKLEIPYRWKKTKTGQYSTNEEKLSELAQNHAIVSQILEHRSLSKLKGTYVDALPKLINPESGRVHTNYNQALVATGRLSSNNPNLQNIPIRTEAGRKIRQAFIPRDENHILLAADYSQIELRIIADLSKDEKMLAAFKQGQDIHQATAANVFNVALEDVTPDQRRAAKTVNFSIIYGAGATNLSKQLDIPRAEAKELIEQYLKTYSGLQNYMERQVAKAREDGFVKTLLGRRRYLADINSRNGMMRSHAERNAINTPIQGTAADMIKIAMINIYKELKNQNLNTKMIMQVHDELVFDVPKNELEIVEPLVRKLMKTALPQLDVPIIVGMDTGADWLEAH